MNITEHFSLEELTATTSGLDNTPSEEQLKNLTYAASRMEIVRAILGNHWVYVSSGFRSPEVNTHEKGSKTSAHLDGFAIDFTVSGLTNEQICQKLWDSGINFDQMIDENDHGVRWVHISFAPRMRHQWLVCVNGVYTEKKA